MIIFEQKVRQFTRYRVQYQKIYTPVPKARKCLEFASPEFIDMVRIVLGWTFGNLAWDTLKEAVKNWTGKFGGKKSLPVDIQCKIRNSVTLRTFSEDIKKGLTPFDKLNSKTRTVLEEEILSDCASEILVKILKRKVAIKKIQDTMNRDLTKSLKRQKNLRKSFTKKEKQLLRAYFQKYLYH